ncbi:hypothetical protein DRQ50_13495 [bacterium]|nr:MAG: hypothetical protein DRQ50_13495 [bacterium]
MFPDAINSLKCQHLARWVCRDHYKMISVNSDCVVNVEGTDRNELLQILPFLTLALVYIQRTIIKWINAFPGLNYQRVLRGGQSLSKDVSRLTIRRLENDDFRSQSCGL